MSCKTLLVHLDDSTHSNARLDYALQIAARHHAHLIGLYAVGEELAQPLFLHGEERWSAACEAQRDHNLRSAQADFLAAARRTGCSTEWRAADGPPT